MKTLSMVKRRYQGLNFLSLTVKCVPQQKSYRSTDNGQHESAHLVRELI